jgi:hypothetical protein
MISQELISAHLEDPGKDSQNFFHKILKTFVTLGLKMSTLVEINQFLKLI